MKAVHWFIVIAKLVLAAYIFNMSFTFIELGFRTPAIDNAVVFLAGIALINGAISHYQVSKYKP